MQCLEAQMDQKPAWESHSSPQKAVEGDLDERKWNEEELKVKIVGREGSYEGN